MNEFPFIDLHTHQHNASDEMSYAVLNILAGTPIPTNPSIKCSYGIHPWQIKTGNLTDLIKKLKHAAAKPQIIAIGEAGLDKLIETPLNEQATIFEIQLKLALEHQKPLIIHAVKAYSELLAMRKKHPSGSWILHGFDGKKELAKQLINKNIHLSVGAALMKSNHKISETLASIPLKQLFLETDEQTDYAIEEIYCEAAKILKMNLEDLKKQLFTNFAAHFTIPD